MKSIWLQNDNQNNNNSLRLLILICISILHITTYDELLNSEIFQKYPS